MAQLTDTLVSGDERVTGMIYGTQAGNYATCSTPAATAAKVVTIPGFVLTLGVHVRIKFSANNTAATPTLNVSDTGAKAIKVKGNNLAAAGDLAANGIYEFVYDGTNWELTCAVCGKATTANYGYVQLATGDMNGAANVDGVAVSKNHTHSQYLEIANVSLEGQSTTILAQVQSLAANNIHYKRFYTSSDGGSANISDKPTGTTNAGFMLEAYCNRRASSSDWRYVVLCYVQANKPKIAWIQNGTTSISWQDLNTNTDTKVTATAKANTDNANYKILATASASPTSGAATEAVYDTDITLNPSTNTITANISGNAATATSANITRTADTTNGDKLQIGSGTAVNVVNSQSTLNVAAGSATTNTNARHIWFSDSSTETKRAYSGDLTYRTDYNRITTNISGYATGLTRQCDIHHQGATSDHPVHRIASYPSPNITAQGGNADNSLVLHLFTKGHNASDYGIVLITAKLAGTVSNNPTVNVRWKLRSSGMPTEAVQAAFIKDASGLWHVDVFFIVQHQYQLTVFNKLGSFSALDGSPNGGWVLHSSNVDNSYADGKECYTDISGDSDDTASMRLYNSIGYDGAATGITDDGIVGTAGSATVADKLANGAGGAHQPVYIPTSGTDKGIPKAIGVVQKADNQYYVDMPADRAYGAVVATTADKAGALNLNGAVGSATRPVYFNAEGAPVAISYKSGEEVGGDSCLNLTVSKAYIARYLNGYSLSVGSYGGVTNTIYFD